MVLSFLFSTDLQYFGILAVQILRGLGFGLSFLILWGWGWFPHRQEGAKSFWDPESKGLPRVSCTVCNPVFAPGQPPGCTGARGFSLPRFTRPFAPSPNLTTFGDFSYFSTPLPGALVCNSDPPILAFCDFLALFVFRFFWLFWGVFPLFSKDFRGSAKRKTLALFRGFPCFFSSKKARVGGVSPFLGSDKP